ncbi:MAG: glycosyl hydrolase family 18 protein, partial [Lachnospiraceae bacterium]|nr:glycosyl hydrolase family 18 protein [Lachnospiraceae bacterium]
RKKRRQKRKQMLPALIVLGLIVIVLLLAAVGEIFSRFTPSSEHADLEALYGTEDGYASVIANHQWIDSQALWFEDHAYLSYEVIRDELNGRFYWDSVEKLLLYTLPEETVRADADTEYDGAPVFLEQDDTVYISLSYVQEYSNIQVEYFENPTRLVLQTEWGSEQVGTLSKDTELRVLGGIKSEILADLEAGEEVTILNQMDTWSEVQTEGGLIGYILNSAIGETETVETTGPYTEPEYTSISVDYDICLVWQQVIDTTGLESQQSFIDQDTAATTKAPTWFSITGEDGTFSSSASAEYVETAHAAGLDVWVVLENVNHTEVDMTELLTSTTNRMKLIEGVMEELEACGADGLNVDIENLDSEDGDGFIQLIRELSVECRARGLVLSVDNSVPSAWTEFYNREEQGIVADYVIIMGYDEHYNGSEPGSTASLSFVQAGITDTLEEVPAEKVINGVPFYTRLWTETSTELTSEALGMEAAAEFVAEHGGEASWLSDVGQNYVKIEEDGTVYQIWLEDEDSMKTRLSMMQSYELAGVAFWKLGMESESIWDVIADYYSE